MRMTRLFGLFSFLLLLCSSCFAQFTSTTGTIIDGDSTVWFGAKITVTWVPNVNYPNSNQYMVNGVPLNSPFYQQYLQQTVQSNNSGQFNMQLIDNTQISPEGSSWKFTIQSYTSAPSSTFPNLAVQGTSQDVSAFITSNITAPRFPATAGQYGGAYGYSTGEVSVIPVPGGSFFNVTSGVINVWACAGVASCSWQTQAVGSFCSPSAGCNFTGAITTTQFNNTCEASTQTGVNWVEQVNNCANQSYMTNGGIITGYGYAAGVYVASQEAGNVTPQLTALSGVGRPITLLLNPAATFVWNGQFSSTIINQAIAVGNSGGGGCAIPLGNGSTINGMGFNNFTKGEIQLGPNAQTYDLVCPNFQDGTQESMQLKNIGLRGNATAQLAGALLHIRNIFTNTEFDNVTTYTPYGNAVVVEGGSDINFKNCVIADGAQSGNYVGTVLTIVGTSHATFTAGAIQNNGVHNALMVVQGFNATYGVAGGNVLGTHFYNVDFEITPATVGSFTGHATNVDPIQVTDASDFLIDSLVLFGNKGVGQQHIVDIGISGANGQINGPVEIDNITAGLTQWGGAALITNSAGSVFPALVQGRLASIVGTQNGSQVNIGKYRWEGGLQTQGQETDYLDNENVANFTGNNVGTPSGPFSNQPTCNSLWEGHIASITDSTTSQDGSIITGGGFLHVSGYCNGTNWLVGSGSNTSSQLIQSILITSGFCTTSGLAWAQGECLIGSGFSWPTAFANTNYNLNCQLFNGPAGTTNLGAPGGAGAIMAFGSISSTTSIQVGLYTATAAAQTPSSGAWVSCIGIGVRP